MISAAELGHVLIYAPDERIARFIDVLNAAMREASIEGPRIESAFLAQIAHESGELRYTRELASGKTYDGREDLGNTKEQAIAAARAHDSTPGPWWKGRGLIQVTGFDNYVACGQALGLDLIDEPQLLEEPAGACRSAAWFWRNAKLRNGTHIDLNPVADTGDILKVSRVVNLGMLETSRIPNHFEERAKYYARFVSIYAKRTEAED